MLVAEYNEVQNRTIKFTKLQPSNRNRKFG